jgi:multidrug efflux pump subunit AcrA (membrane-fusion protein)
VAAAQVKRDEAALLLERMTIRAPISGVVQRRLKQNGDKVMRGMDSPHSAHLVHLYHPKRIQVRVDVPLADAANIFVGQRCEVFVDVLPETAFAGEVIRITHEADLQKNTLQAKVRVVDPSPLLRPEMLSRVKFLPDTDRSTAAGSNVRRTPEQTAAPAVRIARTALVDADAEDTAVFVVRERKAGVGVLDRARVAVRSIENGWARVAPALGDTLHPGDLLAAEPAGLKPGQRVRVARSASTPNIAAAPTSPGGDS